MVRRDGFIVPRIRRAAVAGLVAGILMAGVGPARSEEKPMEKSKTKEALFAVFTTSEGKIVAELYPDIAPQTVANFVGLAEGTKAFTDPVAGVKAQRPYYDGTIFHRIIPGFMMQGGDPTGTGRGGPGYTIPDEFAGQEPKYDRPGRLGMARTGAPNSGGSQFFIMHKPYPSLNNQYTIFGQVVEGQDVVDKICGTYGSSSGKPSKEIKLEKVVIERRPASESKGK